MVSVLHEVSMALQSDDLVVMARGRITHHGASRDPATHAALCAVFGNRIRIVALEDQWVALPTMP